MTDTPNPQEVTMDKLVEPWAFDADENTITCEGAPIFTVMREWDFPCIEDEGRPAADMEYMAHAQVVVMLLNMVATTKEETTGEALSATIRALQSERSSMEGEILRLVDALAYAHAQGFEWPIDPLPFGSIAHNLFIERGNDPERIAALNRSNP